MDVLVYGFSRGPGQLPDVMNVARDSLRLKFRALTAWPDFSACDAVILPLDTYSSWQETEAADPRLDGVLVRAAVALRHAAARGAAVAFVYEDLFAHHQGADERPARSLGGMLLEELGLSRRRLPVPEDRQEVLAPAFADHLGRFGLCESYLETRHCRRPVEPLCRTGERHLTGLTVREGEGSLALLPGYPRHRPLDFFTSLGAALGKFRGGGPGDDACLFTEERRLQGRRREVLRQLEGVDRRLAFYRRCRDLLAAAPVSPTRQVPE